ncbi:MAG TPA: 5-methyltetrahydropteroyltriglutamate--homocysteine S-methyltransferase [Bryobacteraceae bacterium]|nr:5-methyltetrahydropteroyltriglutamate--homocysteine S-methyltransferase [Bryobacteraceae bacterium]
MPVTPTNLGFPRIGAHRELKKALESYWASKLSEAELLETAKKLRHQHWQWQQQAGIAHVPSNDFSLYDHVLDTTAMVGAVPRRYGWSGGTVDLKTYFAMARGSSEGAGVTAMEMTKWFDTNYHYIVPEFEAGQTFRLASTKAVDEFLEAKALGIQTRPVLLGPISFLLLGKSKSPSFDPISLVTALFPVYEEVLRRLHAAGAEWIQIDEPCLVLDLPEPTRGAFTEAYRRLSAAAAGTKILVATYFESLHSNLTTALQLPVAGLHLDLVRGPGQLDAALAEAPPHLTLSLGVIDGRNIWKADLSKAVALVEQAVRALGSERVLVAPSCSLLHVPVDLNLETGLEEVKDWLAFARQKLEEVATICAARPNLEANRASMERRRVSTEIHDDKVKERLASLSAEDSHRSSPYPVRRDKQQTALGLPLFPTTTIGSFPQTKEVRAARADHKAGKLSQDGYDAFLRRQVEEAVRFQEEIGIDVLVHGEFERNDMVEYFGEQLSGFTATTNGWVQSYGSRCVKPPIIFGDVKRLGPMTIEWSRFAQSLTRKPVKGMLTGPVTILQWSFVRDDQPRSETCRQIALAIRDEVAGLEAAGIRIIQIDEPAIREGLPLRKSDWPAYLAWAVEAFRLSSSVVKDETQVHTHMCYAEFNDIIEAIGALDADVISIETSRSQMELLEAFARYQYPSGIGPGVYDIHSPRIPTADEMVGLLKKALAVLRPEQLWVNPDCGLKTRSWKEVLPALAAMVVAARRLRN